MGNANPAMCWWCQKEPADSREHKFKKTDLARAFVDAERAYHMSADNRLHAISGKNANAMKFPRSLCRNCNNARSQPFDDAYSTWSAWIEKNHRWLWMHGSVNMRSVFGETWPDDVLNLARYYVKHIGCRMVADEYAVPPSLIDFLDGGPCVPDMHMQLFRDVKRFWRGATKFRYNLGDVSLVSIGSTHGARDDATGHPTVYQGDASVRYIGLAYCWERGTEQARAFYLSQRPRLFHLDQGATAE